MDHKPIVVTDLIRLGMKEVYTNFASGNIDRAFQWGALLVIFSPTLAMMWIIETVGNLWHKSFER